MLTVFFINILLRRIIDSLSVQGFKTTKNQVQVVIVRYFYFVSL